MKSTQLPILIYAGDNLFELRNNYEHGIYVGNSSRALKHDLSIWANTNIVRPTYMDGAMVCIGSTKDRSTQYPFWNSGTSVQKIVADIVSNEEDLLARVAHDYEERIGSAVWSNFGTPDGKLPAMFGAFTDHYEHLGWLVLNYDPHRGQKSICAPNDSFVRTLSVNYEAGDPISFVTTPTQVTALLLGRPKNDTNDSGFPDLFKVLEMISGEDYT